jgi:hypothetical protein
MSPRRRNTQRTGPRTPSSPAAWITARARNALRRPLFIGTISVLTFLASLIALIIVPEQAKKAAAAIRPSSARPDTEATVVSVPAPSCPR